MGQAEEDRWYTLIETDTTSFQLDKNTFSRRMTDNEYNIICWTRILIKKDGAAIFTNQEYLATFKDNSLKSRMIQGVIEGKLNSNISEWHKVPDDSFENKLFNKIIEYDMTQLIKNK
jgi:hypothetical protein